MFYKQSINNVKVVIIPLDGVLLDLNRLRFNYFKRICKKYDYVLTKETFEKSLGSMKTMYNQFPISDQYNSSEMNSLIEQDLFEYAKLKPDMIKKDGTDELLHFFNQRKIKIAVLSTHKIKDAIRYLQLTKIYHQIDFIIGGDSNLAPLPDTAILDTTMEQMECKPHETMLIANFPSLLAAGNQCMMNIIYLNDLVDANESVIPRVLKITKNNFDIINVFLFSNYDTMEIYSPILGMSSDMDYDTLNDTYQRLLIEYQNDPQLMELVRETYHYYLGQIISSTNIPDNLALFDNQPLKNKKKENVVNTIINSRSNHKTKKNILGTNLKEANDLINLINSQEEKQENNQEEIVSQDNNHKTVNHKTTIALIIDFIYNSIVITLVSFISLVIYVGFMDIINQPGLPYSIIKGIIDFYLLIALAPFKLIINGLSNISSFPGYQALINNSSSLSALAYQLIFCIIFNIIAFYIIKGIYHFIKKTVHQPS